MGEQNRLCPLQVCVAGNHGIPESLGDVEDRRLKISHEAVDRFDLLAQPQAESGRYLVVAVLSVIAVAPPFSSEELDPDHFEDLPDEHN